MQNIYEDGQSNEFKHFSIQQQKFYLDDNVTWDSSCLSPSPRSLHTIYPLTHGIGLVCPSKV